MENGRNRTILWLAGILITLVLFIALPTMANYIVVNDKESRCRDSEIKDNENRHYQELKQDIHEQRVVVVERLTRIEAKL